MDLSRFIRDVVVPAASLATFVACVYFTYMMIKLGSIGGSISVGALSLCVAMFVVNDIRRLFFMNN